jgi:hypothetical protein
MGKLLLVLLVLGNVAAPAIGARDPHPARGVKRAALLAAAVDLAYALVVLVIYPRI